MIQKQYSTSLILNCLISIPILVLKDEVKYQYFVLKQREFLNICISFIFPKLKKFEKYVILRRRRTYIRKKCILIPRITRLSASLSYIYDHICLK